MKMASRLTATGRGSGDSGIRPLLAERVRARFLGLGRVRDGGLGRIGTRPASIVCERGGLELRPPVFSGNFSRAIIRAACGDAINGFRPVRFLLVGRFWRDGVNQSPVSEVPNFSWLGDVVGHQVTQRLFQRCRKVKASGTKSSKT
jgi:hypothetical protein